MLLALDTETTGVDLRHGAQPFLVTTCTGDGVVRVWGDDWRVDPLTRRVLYPAADLDDIRGLVDAADTVVMQNAKFDVAALDALAPADWPWEKTHDTLLLAHLLHSNQRKDLTSLAVRWVGYNPQRHEDRLEEAVKDARRFCRSRLKDWAVARDGRPDMPSCKEAAWRSDYWLPRAVWLECGEQVSEWAGGDRSWWGTVLREYAETDAEVTVLVYKAMLHDCERRGLTKLYEERRKLLRIAYGMESSGVTASEKMLTALDTEYRATASNLGRTCVGIAGRMGHALELPKAGNNKSVMAFVTSPTGLNVQARADLCDAGSVLLPRNLLTDTGNVSLDKDAIPYIEKELQAVDPEGRRLTWLRAFRDKRKLDTFRSYMEAYRRYWVPTSQDGWYTLRPGLNITGTDTLRWSSANPNSQNVSKQDALCDHCHGEDGVRQTCRPCRGTGMKYRSLRCVLGPGPGREWWSMDAKGIEDRLPAYRSKQQELIRIFEEPDAPPYYGSNHLLRFHTVYPEIWEKHLKEVWTDKNFIKKRYGSDYYQWCKNGGFAVQYGAVDRPGGGGTADRAFHKLGAHRLLKERFSKLEELNQQCIRFAVKHGYVETFPDKTVDPDRGYPLMVTRTEYGKVLETVPLNYVIQGTAMWWTARGMVRCQEQIDEWNREVTRRGRDPVADGYRIAIQQHDELVFDVPKRADPRRDPKSSNLGRMRVLKKLMEQGGDGFGIPTPVGVEYHPDNWGTGVSF